MNHSFTVRKILVSLISIFIALISFSAQAYEEYTVSSVDRDAGTQILIHYSATSPGTQTSALLGDPNGINILPSIAQSNKNQLVAVWQHFKDGNFDLHFSIGAKNKWSAPLKIDTGMAVNVSPFVACVGSQLMLFWSSTVEDQDFIFYTMLNKGFWTPPEKVPGQTLPINILPRVISERGKHFVEWLASGPTAEYSIQRHQLDASILQSLSSVRSALTSAQHARRVALAFTRHQVKRAPVFIDAASVDSPHTRFSLKIENDQSQHKARKILQY